MTTTPSAPPDVEPLLRAMLNLTASHREHEKFYAAAPREQAVVMQRHARTLQALADHWTTASPDDPTVLSPFEGALDLTAPAALQLDGVLFMEGQGEPTEIRQLKRDLRLFADDAAAAGEWLTNAMQASWDVAWVLLDVDGLADMLGERHRIIANDWQAASVMTLAAKVLARAADVLDHVDFTPTALRADLGAGRIAPQRLYSAAEMLGHAADLFSEFATLVHDNERRWRVFRARVEHVVAALTDPVTTPGRPPDGS